MPFSGANVPYHVDSSECTKSNVSEVSLVNTSPYIYSFLLSPSHQSTAVTGSLRGCAFSIFIAGVPVLHACISEAAETRSLGDYIYRRLRRKGTATISPHTKLYTKPARYIEAFALKLPTACRGFQNCGVRQPAASC